MSGIRSGLLDETRGDALEVHKELQSARVHRCSKIAPCICRHRDADCVSCQVDHAAGSALTRRTRATSGRGANGAAQADN